MSGKWISIFLICLFAFYLLIAPVNAQKTMSVKEFNTNYPLVGEGKQRVYDHVIISGFIRDIKIYSGGRYFFTVDDGTGVIWKGLIYFGGLGDIKEGDKVFVEINPSKPLKYSFEGKEYELIPGTSPWEKDWIVISTISKKPEAASAPKTPGFEIVIGAVAMFFAWKKLLKRR